jgi:catechol 2,3-dioxygenase-like lactoylglutathione lyase family enzyme
MIKRFDHLVLTVADLTRATTFYRDVLGMTIATFDDGKTAAHFGDHKINFHLHGHEFEPKAEHPTPGSGDLCFEADVPIADVVSHLEKHRVAIELGPVARTGAHGAMTSVYFRDPDANLIELSQYR